ncbi:chemotaxis protein CheD [Yoonia sediminilitoris]|uniref:Probable chemoreceptor glutamine deamidase CheD n=1 Tax=Yoonia sediminilitoris TaxID=1286148 RepID=A0A2T6KQ95_9RHOB|nr:chemotaxis protein CheD [Yoonia sediminilitoris]PUB18731.1 chemotaxis protein CheD [Yoonia sediminilitoris]RCW98899.1 chemotaxis protein CheD [Yoonia sediminilitoris]
MSFGAPSTNPQKTVTVVQGEYSVSADPAVVMSTVLGSCISVCLYDDVASVGGMNHFLLAGEKGSSSSDLKYGVNAMELLINKVLRAGGNRDNLKAKLFGGARMTTHARDIGQSNGIFAKEFLEREGIPCISQSIGGDMARRVQFVPTTGAARQLQVSGQAPDEVVKPQPKPVDDITLF